MSRLFGAWSSHCFPPFWLVGGGAGAEPEAVIAGLQDVAMMGEPVEQSGGHLGVPEHHMMPLSLIGESLMFRLSTPIIPFLGPIYG